MSSFKRKVPAKAPPAYPGTRSSPQSPSTSITSSGIPSLDDILGGGLPLSCALLVVAPDLHSSYGELVQKFFVAEGLACNHRVCLVDGRANAFLTDVMWLPKSSQPGTETVQGEDDDKSTADDGEKKVKIAWRYENMKQFQTTITSSVSADNYCHLFDLSTHIPKETVDAAVASGRLSLLEDDGLLSPKRVLAYLTDLLQSERSGTPASVPTRICVPSLGSPAWGDLGTTDILHFLHSLRSLLRKYDHACASVSLPPHMCTEKWGGHGWLQKLGWVCDAEVTMAAFSANPSLSATFPSQHGLAHVHKLPAPHSLVAASDRFSTLRGVSSSGGGGENNLAFKCTRKRLIFETLHLDVDGGVSERRTTAPVNILEEQHARNGGAVAAVDVALEDGDGTADRDDARTSERVGGDGSEPVRPKKKGKKVGFQSDRPELYDF